MTPIDAESNKTPQKFMSLPLEVDKSLSLLVFQPYGRPRAGVESTQVDRDVVHGEERTKGTLATRFHPSLHISSLDGIACESEVLISMSL